jgi:hypothetical protein
MMAYPLKKIRLPLFVLTVILVCTGCHPGRQLPATATNSPLPGVDSNFHLYLLVGQSNMAGRGVPDSLSTISHSAILMFTKDQQWVPATDPVHFDKKEAGVGPAISFAQTMLEDARRNKNIKIGLIPCAVGGTAIGLWQPGAFDNKTNTHPYDDALQRATAAMKQGVLKGILWHQGEANASPEKRVVYIDTLAALIERFRKELKVPNIPFVAGELGYFTEDKKAFNVILQQLPQHEVNTQVVSAAGLTANPDNLHFNTASARELGSRYAKAMKAVSIRSTLHPILSH